MMVVHILLVDVPKINIVYVQVQVIVLGFATSTTMARTIRVMRTAPTTAVTVNVPTAVHKSFVISTHLSRSTVEFATQATTAKRYA